MSDKSSNLDNLIESLLSDTEYESSGGSRDFMVAVSYPYEGITNYFFDSMEEVKEHVDEVEAENKAKADRGGDTSYLYKIVGIYQVKKIGP